MAGLKMAKASEEEWEKVLAFVHEVQDAQRTRIFAPPENLARIVLEAPPLMRTVFGYDVLLKNACDPNDDCLAFHPGILQSITTLRRLAATAKMINAQQHAGAAINPDLWSDLFQLTNEADAALEKLPNGLKSDTDEKEA